MTKINDSLHCMHINIDEMDICIDFLQVIGDIMTCIVQIRRQNLYICMQEVLSSITTIMPYVPAGAAVQNSGFDGANETILIWYDSVQCRGNEARLIDCIVSEPRLHNCDHSQDVGVRCGKTMWFTYIIASLSGSSL